MLELISFFFRALYLDNGWRIHQVVFNVSDVGDYPTLIRVIHLLGGQTAAHGLPVIKGTVGANHKRFIQILDVEGGVLVSGMFPNTSEWTLRDALRWRGMLARASESLSHAYSIYRGVWMRGGIPSPAVSQPAPDTAKYELNPQDFRPRGDEKDPRWGG